MKVSKCLVYSGSNFLVVPSLSKSISQISVPSPVAENPSTPKHTTTTTTTIAGSGGATTSQEEAKLVEKGAVLVEDSSIHNRTLSQLSQLEDRKATTTTSTTSTTTPTPHVLVPP